MGTGKAARQRRVVYQWLFARHKRDDRAINAMVDRAEKVATGTRPLNKDRFVRIDATGKGMDWGLVERARQLAVLKGYVTNLPLGTMPGSSVIAAYHDLWQVEKSFRMAKSDLRARPIFHHQRDAIEAHLTVVFAAPRGQPLSPSHHRGVDQEARSDAPALADRPDRRRRAPDHCDPADHRRSPRHSRPATAHNRARALNLCKSGQIPTRRESRLVDGRPGAVQHRVGEYHRGGLELVGQSVFESFRLDPARRSRRPYARSTGARF